MNGGAAAAPVAKSVFVWNDGNAAIAQWVPRWFELAGRIVEFRPKSQLDREVRERLGLTEVELEADVLLVVDGVVHVGPAAVLRATSATTRWRTLAASWLYEREPFFRSACDALYRFAVRSPAAASRVTNFMWGHPLPETWTTAQALVMRLLGVVGIIAFVSLGVQLSGLVGVDGILPAAQWLDAVREYLGVELHALSLFHRVPTVFWFLEPGWMHWVCGGGVLACAMLVVGVLPRVALPLAWLAYLSLTVIAQDFARFQWDTLLLEAFVAAWFLVPWRVFRLQREEQGPWLGPWAMRLLLFKLMFSAGVVKYLGDELWRSGRALDYHFWTQPIPNLVAPVVHAAGIGELLTWLTLVVELPVPFLFFGPRRLRHAAVGLTLLLQVGIGLTGTYGFFNLLTIAIALASVDDQAWESVWSRLQRPEWKGWPARTRAARLPMIGLVAICILIPTWAAFGRSQLTTSFSEAVGAFRTFNSYGLFARMTTERREIMLEGSDDGSQWRRLQFRYKPDAPEEPLRVTTLHMPRVDWQMWFAALGTCERNPWFQRLLLRVLQGSDEVGKLLDPNSVPAQPPRYLRSPVYEYTFGGEPWVARPAGYYCPTAALGDDGRLVWSAVGAD